MLALHNGKVWGDLLELSNGSFNRALEAAVTDHAEKHNSHEPLTITFTIPVNNPIMKIIHAKLEIPSELVREMKGKNLKWYSTTLVEPEKKGFYIIELEDGSWSVARYSNKSWHKGYKDFRPVRFALPRLPID